MPCSVHKQSFIVTRVKNQVKAKNTIMWLTLKQAQQKGQTLIHTAELNPPDLPASIMEMMIRPFQGPALIP